MTERPLVSVVIPAFNAARFLAAAIESVLAQTYQPMECIVVDDGSEDESLEIARGSGDRVRVIEQANSGVSAARNRGVQEARGRFVAFLDADDLWVPTKLERQIAVAEASDDVVLVYSALQIIDEGGAMTGSIPAPPPELALTNTLLLEGAGVSVAQTGLIPRGVFQSLGGFDETLSTSADADLACRLALEGLIVRIDEPLACYRRHSAQMHLDPAATERDMMRVFAKLFDHPRLPADIARSRTRAEANLFTILAASCLLNRRPREGARYLLKAVRRVPSRPVRVGLNRLARPFRNRWSATGASKREGWLADGATHASWEKAYRTPDAAAFFEVAFDWIREQFSGCRLVIDAGCGTGAHSIRLARRGLQVAALDLSEPALQAGRRKIQASGLGGSVTLSRQDLVALGVSPASVACVLCWGVLMHVPDLEAAVAELRRVMKKQGVLILSEVNARSPEATLIRLANRVKNRGGVRAAKAGFEITRSDRGAAAFTRHSDIAALVKLVEGQGFRLERRRAGQLTELYSRTTSHRLRLGLGRLNVWWFKRRGPAGLAVGNILLFRAE